MPNVPVSGVTYAAMRTRRKWMPHYPVWSLAYITIVIFLIYALAAHGGAQ